MKLYVGYQIVFIVLACEFYNATKYNKLKLNQSNKKRHKRYNFFSKKLHLLS